MKYLRESLAFRWHKIRKASSHNTLGETMLESRGQSEAPNHETILACELAAIVGWLSGLPKEEIGDLCQALASHDAANLSGYLARFQNHPQSSTSES